MEDGAPAIPVPDESARLDALHELGVLDTPADPCFDRIARTAATVMDAPRAAILFLDKDRVWLKARVGIEEEQYPRLGSLAGEMGACREVTISADLERDPRFAAKLPELAQVDVRFYGCAPLILPDGALVGLLAVGDTEPHETVTDAQSAALADLAALAVDELMRRKHEREAQAQRRYDDQRVALALETAGLGEFEWRMDTDQIFVSDRVQEITGATRDNLKGDRGQVTLRSVHPDDVERVRREIDQQLKANGRYCVEYRMIRPSDNQVRWMRGAGMLANGPDGSPRLIGVLQDRTQLQLDEEHRAALLAELDHRVKNVLATVQSLASQSARKTTNVDAFLKTFAGRLKAMASAHELLTATRWRGAMIGHICAAELGGLSPGQCRWEGPEIMLTPRAANALSLALHELASNAVRYGALSVATGRVVVSWKERPGGGFELSWEEHDGPPVSPPKRQGFGATMLEQVAARELGGEVSVDYHRDGVRAHITAEPASTAAEAGPAEAAAATPRPEGASIGEAPPAKGDVKGLRILIVEDAVLLALELEAGLNDAGANVIGTAIELDEAMEFLSRDFDAAVLDVNLNGRLVTPFAEALKGRRVPFIFATGYGETNAPEGFDAPIVRKPYNVGQIIAALVEATGRG